MIHGYSFLGLECSVDLKDHWAMVRCSIYLVSNLTLNKEEEHLKTHFLGASEGLGTYQLDALQQTFAQDDYYAELRVRTISESRQDVRTSIESPANPLGSAIEPVGEITVSTFIWMKVPPDVNKLVRFRVFWGCKEILESCCLDLGVARCLIPIGLRVREV